MSEKSGPVRMILREESDDGCVVDTAYVSMPDTVNDPYVRSRITPAGQGVPREVITEFVPAPERPVSYLPTLPFVPGRAVFTTEPSSPAYPSGARWPCTDAPVLLESLVQISLAADWRRIPLPPREQLLGSPDIVLERGDVLRELQVVPVDG
ncbi:MAG TPA: hypothetical protein VE967_13265, partial [Gemmatimonadaceae bacterium]|nr:hypothetical protein [Gemmatimonadaceae bacterium]